MTDTEAPNDSMKSTGRRRVRVERREVVERIEVYHFEVPADMTDAQIAAWLEADPVAFDESLTDSSDPVSENYEGVYGAQPSHTLTPDPSLPLMGGLAEMLDDLRR